MMTSDKKLTKKDIRGMFWRSLPMEFSWHYERQMHMGFTFMLAKILQKLYGDDKEKLAAALQRHMEFFNCTPALSSFIGGIIASMEEKNANNEAFDTSSINTIKSALMGPLSGIGDSIILGTLRILAVGIGTSLAMQGNILGPILFLLVFNVPNYLLHYLGAVKGYELGTDFLEKIQKSGLMEKFMFAAALLGVMVVGVSTPLTIGVGETASALQDILDGIMPGLLSLGVMGAYYKLLEKKVSAVWLIVGTAALGIVCAQFGILG